MGKLVVHQEKITDLPALLAICPFGAMEEKAGKIEINAACKLCKLCVKKGGGVFEFVEEKVAAVDKSAWQGIAVYVDHVGGRIHPVTLELIGKAQELAAKISQPVYAIFIGDKVSEAAEELLHYGVTKVFVVESGRLKYFTVETYATAMEAFINQVKPAAILVGATPVGRQLAPRVAARFKTGLTADCTILDIHENSDLVQIRPAFGGNIMAEILTPNTRPQMATVRYKIMDAPKREAEKRGSIETVALDENGLTSRVEVLKITPKPKETSIENATVRPKLIITCGVSGAIQFLAGMDHAENIFAINSDPKAAIFKAANYAVIGDIYEILPKLTEMVKAGGGLL